MTEQNELITILKDAINDKKNDVKEYNNRLDQNLSLKMQLLEDLRQDVNEITKVDMNTLNEIIQLFPLSDDKKTSLMQELDIIKALLTLNQTEQTNYTLLPNQLAAFTTFIECLEKYIEAKNQEKQSIDPEYNHIMVLTNQYKSLLSKLKRPNNMELITDIDTILHLFQENKIDEDKKQAILLSLIKYNQEVISKKEKQVGHRRVDITTMELTTIFQRYGYDFSKLDAEYQVKLKKEGNRKNIDEVLNAMQEVGFSKLREESSGLILTSLLLGSTKDIVHDITNLAGERGVNLTTIEKLVSAYLPNRFLWDGCYQIGKMEDFKKNLTLLAEHGISIPAVAEKEKELLITSNTRLQKNLEWLEKYGLYSDTVSDLLLDDFLSSLLSQNIPEVIDLWIESHPLGVAYIKNNLSVLASYLSDEALLFYKLYISRRETDASPFRLTVSNGLKKLHLRKEFTKDAIPYLGIHDLESAKEITQAFEILFDNEEKYLECAKLSLTNTISDNIFDHPYIVSMNDFSDPHENLLYDICSIKISKLKVLRIFDSLCKAGLGDNIDALLFAVTYHKIFSEDEYQQLVRAIRNAVDTEREIL